MGIVLKDKPWYMSKTIWAAVIVAAMVILTQCGVDLSAYNELIYGLAAALGITGIRGALDEIKK